MNHNDMLVELRMRSNRRRYTINMMIVVVASYLYLIIN